jgi:archaellum component FlaC
MDMENVTNGMLYELIRDFKNDVNRRFGEVDKRLDGIDKRFEGIDRRFENIDVKFEQARLERMELREMILQDRQKLNEVYEARNNVSVSFSRAFVGVSLVLSALVSAVTSLFVSK